MRVRREESGQEISLDGAALARGGEAAVYAVHGERELVAKVYHQPSPEHAAKLAAMLAAPPVDVRAGAGHLTVAWPLERLLAAGERGRVVGCLLPRVEDSRLIAEVCNPHARLQAYPLFHYGSLLRTARNLAAAVKRLHERGYILGDLNESNVLVNGRGLVTLVDADSFQVPGPDRLYRCRVGKAEYTPPELQTVSFDDVDRRPEHDAFALAVLVFQLLMQGLHPFAGLFTGAGEPPTVPQRIVAGHWPYGWARSGPFEPLPYAPPWTVLPPPVQELFSRCFEEGHSDPGSRPGAADWQQALDEAESLLQTCSVNDQHRYAGGLDVCPWCVLARQQDQDPFPAPSEIQARQARAVVAAAAVPAPTGTVPPGVLDPDDPLPPRPTVAPVDAPNPGQAAPGLRQSNSLGRWWPGLVWGAAAAVGGLVGILFALWNYQEPAPADPEPSSIQRAAPRPLPEDRPPPRRSTLILPPQRIAEPGAAPRPLKPKAPRVDPRSSAAEVAWRRAVRHLQKAREHYQQSTDAYRQSIQDFREGRVPAQTVRERALSLHQEAVRLRKLERVVEEKARLLSN